MERITDKIFNELADQGLLNAEHFLATDHYLVVKYNGLIHQYLKEMNFNTSGRVLNFDGNDEAIIIEINR